MPALTKFAHQLCSDEPASANNHDLHVEPPSSLPAVGAVDLNNVSGFAGMPARIVSRYLNGTTGSRRSGRICSAVTPGRIPSLEPETDGVRLPDRWSNQSPSLS